MNKEDVFSILKQEVVCVLPSVSVNDIQLDVKLTELGANSIDRAEVTINCMHALNVHIETTQLAEVKNINDLVNVLYSAYCH